MKKNGKKVFIRTFGCQMNAYDSQVAGGILEEAGFEVIFDNDDTDLWKKKASNLSSDPQTVGVKKICVSNGISEVSDKSLCPDIILMNTCSVRDHAEERVWGRLGMLGVEKKERPGLVIGLMGCMVEEHREKLFKRFPYLDLMVGTRHIKELPEMIRQVYETRKQVARIKQDGISIEYSEYTKRDSGFHAWLPIMTGCNKECTFCIVPMTRGSEVSMPADAVCREARRLVGEGVKWITLLGQNVNSYSGQGTTSAAFPGLLEMLCEIDGLQRISFTTSHPQDATEELFQTIARNPKIGRRFHLPLQSGSDRILKRMKRLHTYEEYKAKIDRLRELVPEISVTTDIISGFSGETEDDHRATRRALEEIRFDSAYIYKYSVRPGTPAARLPDDVPFEVKSARNQDLLKVQSQITEQKSRLLLGKRFTVFVESRHAENSGEMVGRMDQDRRVIIEGEGDPVGQFVRVELTGLSHETFRGRLL